MRNLQIKLDEKDLCFKCLQRKKNIKTYKVEDRGYGSEFDNLTTKLQICEDCLDGKHEELEKWFNEKCEFDKDEFYFEIYKHENKLKNFIDKLPLEGQELFYNSCEKNHATFDREDWIKSVSASFINADININNTNKYIDADFDI